MLDMFYNEASWWIFGTAVIFTFVGRWMSFRTTVEKVTEATIDALIDEGYLKTTGSGKNLEILKHTEWCKDRET